MIPAAAPRPDFNIHRDIPGRRGGRGGATAGPLAAQDTGFVLPELTVFGGARDERALLETPNPVSVIDSDTGLRRQPATHA